jgi:hypothetical protein
VAGVSDELGGSRQNIKIAAMRRRVKTISAVAGAALPLSSFKGSSNFPAKESLGGGGGGFWALARPPPPPLGPREMNRRSDPMAGAMALPKNCAAERRLISAVRSLRVEI